MLYPSINILRDKVDSKYTLVSLAAKRSRDLIDGKPALVDITINKPVSIATEEIANDLISYTRQFETEDEVEIEFYEMPEAAEEVAEEPQEEIAE
ncbi:MAG: DNA-directed RNA polymerase subunit omega [Firmicutes bacterium]|nr:DNA-directed RNA polymerase subunit omega [Bacillota bacterium]